MLPTTAFFCSFSPLAFTPHILPTYECQSTYLLIHLSPSFFFHGDLCFELIILNDGVSSGKSFVSFSKHSVPTWKVQVKYSISSWRKWLANHMMASQMHLHVTWRRQVQILNGASKWGRNWTEVTFEINVVDGVRTTSCGLRFYTTVKKYPEWCLCHWKCLVWGHRTDWLETTESYLKWALVAAKSADYLWKLTTGKALKNIHICSPASHSVTASS